MNATKLKACPFCGGDAESDTQQAFRTLSGGYMAHAVAVYCTKCSVQMTMCHDDFKEYAPEDMLTILTDAWNIRADDQRVAGSLQQAGCAAPCISYPREITNKTTCVYLRDGTKITVERDATTKGPAWLKVSQQARITPAQHNAEVSHTHE